LVVEGAGEVNGLFVSSLCCSSSPLDERGTPMRPSRPSDHDGTVAEEEETEAEAEAERAVASGSLLIQGPSKGAAPAVDTASSKDVRDRRLRVCKKLK
jgi:hypothetical protein